MIKGGIGIFYMWVKMVKVVSFCETDRCLIVVLFLKTFPYLFFF